MKKIFTFIFACVASVAFSHAAVVEGTCGPNLTWSLNTKDSTLTIEGSGYMFSYSYYSYSSSAPWSSYRSYIKYLSLPDSLTSIGKEAFYSCSALTSIEIPNSVTSIGGSAFYECGSLKSVHITDLVAWCKISFCDNALSNPLYYARHLYLNETEIKDLVIPNGVTSIGNYAFMHCSFLTSVTIPNSVTSIGSYAFSDCSGLRSIEIPNSVTSIGSHAFNWCEITSIEIPKSVTSIGSYAFYNYDGLRSVTCKAITPPTCDANVFNIEKTTQTLSVPAISIDAYKNALVWEDFTNIIALPAQNPIVKFVDWDGTLLSAVEVEEGSVATPPADPTREGYTFIGWDKDFSNVTEDMIITAQYKINRYEVQFLDWDNTLLKADSVDWSTAAVAPENPYHKGYSFTGWDKDFGSVKENLVITALFELGEDTNVIISFVNGNDGSDIFDHNTIIKVPAAPEIEGFTFLRWETKADDVENGITIQAIYEADEPQSAPIVINPSNPAQKLIRNGNVYVLTGNKTYTITGQQVK